MLLARRKTPSFVVRCGSRLFSAHSSWSPTQAIRTSINKSGTTDAFYIVNLAHVVRQHERWLNELPRVAPYYAVKCNNDEMVLKTLANLGCGFDCASPAEIDQVRALNVAPERLIYANPCKQMSAMKAARANGVSFTVFDSKEELIKIKQEMPDAQLLVRLRPDDSQSVCRFGMKYGADIAEVGPMLSLAQELGLSVGGVSFHVGSGCYSAEAYADAVELAADAFKIAETHGFSFSLLDIGGGFPGEVRMPSSVVEPDESQEAGDHDAATPSFERPPPTFEAIAAALRPALDKHFPASSGVRLLAEPGRYYVHASHTLATQVIGRKVVDPALVSAANDDSAAAFKYYINDGIYGSFNCLLYDHAHVTPCILAKPAAGTNTMMRPQHPSSVWGPTCDGLDCVLNETMLPELQVGDWMYFEHMGAYTVAASSSFNGFAPPSAEYVYDDVALDEEPSRMTQQQDVLPHVTLVADQLSRTTACRAAVCT